MATEFCTQCKKDVQTKGVSGEACPSCGGAETLMPRNQLLVDPYFSREELIEIMEIASIALHDQYVHERVGVETDLSDDYLDALRDKLDAYMEEREEVEPSDE